MSGTAASTVTKGRAAMGLEPEIGQSLALRRIRVNIHQAKAFFVIFLGEIDPLQAAGVGYCRPVSPRRAQHLMPVDMTQRDVFQLGLLQRADVEHMVGCPASWSVPYQWWRRSP